MKATTAPGIPRLQSGEDVNSANPLPAPEPGPGRRGSAHAGGAGEDSGDANTGLDLAMAQVGDRWTLLVIDALLEGPRRFSDLQEAIPGLAPNVLSARLRRLEAQGLVTAMPYSDRPPRLEYRVSESGRDLAGALRLLARWGASSSGGEVEGPRHRACGTPLEARWYCPTCERVTDRVDDDLQWL